MNHITNYLTFCLNQNLTVFSSFEACDDSEKVVVGEGSKIRLLSFVANKDGIDISFDYNNHLSLIAKLPWNIELSFTHFTSAEDAYKHCKFTKICLGKGLEDWIFIRSPKFATKYAVEVSNQRLSPILEKKIFNNYRYLLNYCCRFDIQLTEKQEEIFLKDKVGSYVALYGIKKIKGRLPETLHNYLIMVAANSKHKDYYVDMYFKNLKNKSGGDIFAEHYVNLFFCS